MFKQVELRPLRHVEHISITDFSPSPEDRHVIDLWALKQTPQHLEYQGLLVLHIILSFLTIFLNLKSPRIRQSTGAGQGLQTSEDLEASLSRKARPKLTPSNFGS